MNLDATINKKVSALIFHQQQSFHLIFDTHLHKATIGIILHQLSISQGEHVNMDRNGFRSSSDVWCKIVYLTWCPAIWRKYPNDARLYKAMRYMIHRCPQDKNELEEISFVILYMHQSFGLHPNLWMEYWWMSLWNWYIWC